MKNNKSNLIWKQLSLIMFGAIFFSSSASSQITTLKKKYSNPFAVYVPVVKNNTRFKQTSPLLLQVPPPTPAVSNFVQLPPPPNLNLIYSGRIIDDSGRLTVFATSQDRLYKLTVGLSLPNGYIVQNISSTQVGFLIPTQNISATLNLPALPQFEIK